MIVGGLGKSIPSLLIPFSLLEGEDQVVSEECSHSFTCASGKETSRKGGLHSQGLLGEGGRKTIVCQTSSSS
jgi:hypothetical protein